MPDLFGPLTRVTLAAGLWIIPLSPLLAAGYIASAPFTRLVAAPGLPAKTRSAAMAGNATLIAAAVSFGWTAWSTFRLAQLDDGPRVLFEHVLRMVRAGQLDVSLDFVLDPMSASVSLAVGAVSLALFVLARAGGASSSVLGWASVLVGATQLAILADNLIITFMGWELAALATVGLTRDVRGFVASRAGDSVLLVGAALLFWGLGGSFSNGDYLPDLGPRFAAVRVASAPEPDDANPPAPNAIGNAWLTMTAYPGAVLFVDDAHTPLVRDGEPLRAPFTHFSIGAGLHSFRIHPAGGLDDYVVSHVPLARDRETALTLFGATVTFTQIGDPLLVIDAHGDTNARASIASRTALDGVRLVTAACLLFFVGAAVRSGQLPFCGAITRVATAPAIVGAFVASTTALLGAHLVLRLHALTALTGVASSVLVIVGALTAAANAWWATRALDVRRVLLLLTASDLGLVMLGAGTSAHAAATLVLVTSAASIGALFMCVIAIEPAGTDLRRLGGLATALPTAARVWFVTSAASWIVSVPKCWLLLCAFETRATAGVPGWIPFALGAAAMALSAHASHRAYLLMFEGKSSARASDLSGATRNAAWLLGGGAAAFGIVLGFGGQLVGKSGTSYFDAWLAGLLAHTQVAREPTSGGVVFGVLLVSVGGAIAGWTLARSRYAGDRPRSIAQDVVAASSTAPSDAVPGAAAANVALGVERWVLDGAQAAIGAASRTVALLVATADDKLMGAGLDAVAERSARLEPRLRAALAVGLVLTVAVALCLALRQTS